MKFYLSILLLLFIANFSLAQKSEKSASMFSMGVENILKRANEGDVDAQTTLGDYYFNGVMVEKDLNKAISWYQKAADKGNIDAQYNLAACYLKATNIENNEEKALEYFTKAADKGHCVAQYNLAACYVNCIGTKRDMSKAYYYFSLASKEISEAEDQLKDITKRMSKKDLATAKELLQKSSLYSANKKEIVLNSDNKKDSSPSSKEAKNQDSMNQKDMRPDDAFEL